MSATTDGDDELAGLAAALETLRRTPAVSPGAVDRVVAAAVARGHRPAGAPGRGVRGLAPGWRIAAGLLLAGGLGAAWRARSVPQSAASTFASVEPAIRTSGMLLPAADAPAADAPLPASFALRRPAAARVALVGDFNGWDPAATPMTRGEDGTWSTTVTLPPGRHAYAFVVDAGTWVTDPRVPATHDADYGRDHSVVVVGTP